jgi:tocopherol O-methyltransferase
MKFSQKDIADYYNTTQTHYETWWKLKETNALHYGIWDEKTTTFQEALLNTNMVLSNLAKITSDDLVLDAGCGVGGTAFFLYKNFKATIRGISLSEKQIETARKSVTRLELVDNVSFHLMDYHETSFDDESFDVIWACESMCHSHDKQLFLKECYRVLKPGGKIVIADYFLTANKIDEHNYVDKWIKTWSVPDLMNEEDIRMLAKNNGFSNITFHDYSKQINRSAKKMFIYSLLAAIPSEIYNLFHPKVSRFAKTHYKCGYYQYKSLQKDLWKYKAVLIEK